MGRNGKNRRNSEVLRANQRGVYAIRRSVDKRHLELFERIDAELESEIRGIDRLYWPNTLHVTVVGFSNFGQKHYNSGPKTSDIIDQSESLHHTLRANLGKLAIFGGERRPKLGFYLNSPELLSEHDECQRLYAENEYPLITSVVSGEIYVPHCSVGEFHPNNVGHHRESLRRYNRLIEFAVGREITLMPPKVHE